MSNLIDPLHAHAGWTAERVELLKKLWVDGLSASQIAKRLGGITRNGAIGKIHRLGLSGRAAPYKPGRPVAAPKPARIKPRMPKGHGMVLPAIGGPTQANPQALKLASAIANAEARLAAPVGPTEPRGSATILTLKPRMCRWPIGSPSDDDFSFCGCVAPGGRPYCAPHHARAHQPSIPSKRSIEPLQARAKARFA